MDSLCGVLALDVLKTGFLEKTVRIYIREASSYDANLNI